MSAADGSAGSIPWGHWLRQEVDGMFVDAEGRRWRTIVCALWEGRLHIDGASGGAQDGLIAFLTASVRRPNRSHEDVRDLFDGSRAFMEFHAAWCRGHGLIDDQGDLTDEGQAVLALLALTRGWELGPLPVGENAVSVVADPGADRAERERMFEEAEAFGAKSPYRFERGTIGRLPVITFSGRHDFSGMPLGAVLWTQDFPDEESRDAFYHWLCLRVDRWGDWGRKAVGMGREHLRSHLLSLVGADMAQAGLLSPRPGAANDRVPPSA